jgi:hypothetical protein
MIINEGKKEERNNENNDKLLLNENIMKYINDKLIKKIKEILNGIFLLASGCSCDNCRKPIFPLVLFIYLFICYFLFVYFYLFLFIH